MIRDFINQFSFSHRVILIFIFFLSVIYIAAFLSTFYIKHEIDLEHRKWADSYVGPLSWGLLFLIAFTISNTWNSLSSTLGNISDEATRLRLIFLYADQLPPEHKKQLILNEKSYVESLKDEWQTLKQGYENDVTRQKIINFYAYLSRINLETENEKAYFTKILNHIDEVMILRRQRIEKSDGLMPKQLLYLIVTLSVLVCFSLGAIRGEVKFSGIWPIIVFSFSISLFLSLILEFNYPFSGDIIPSLDNYEYVFELNNSEGPKKHNKFGHEVWSER